MTALHPVGSLADPEERFLDKETSIFMSLCHSSEYATWRFDGSFWVIDVLVDDKDAEGCCKVPHLQRCLFMGVRAYAESVGPIDGSEDEVHFSWGRGVPLVAINQAFHGIGTQAVEFPWCQALQKCRVATTFEAAIIAF